MAIGPWPGQVPGSNSTEQPEHAGRDGLPEPGDIRESETEELVAGVAESPPEGEGFGGQGAGGRRDFVWREARQVERCVRLSQTVDVNEDK